MEGEKVIHYSAPAAATEGVASVYAEGKKKRGRPKKYGPKKKQRLDVESPQGLFLYVLFFRNQFHAHNTSRTPVGPYGGQELNHCTNPLLVLVFLYMCLCCV